MGITCNGKKYWGVGSDDDIIKASIHALCVSVNKLPEIQGNKVCQDERLMEIMNYIQANYQNVSLSEMAEHFHLSEPYLSKYIHEKSGKTFGDIVNNVKLKKAKTLLRNGTMTVENIAAAVGFPNVEHFSRVFKKKMGMTPIQYRNG